MSQRQKYREKKTKSQKGHFVRKSIVRIKIVENISDLCAEATPYTYIQITINERLTIYFRFQLQPPTQQQQQVKWEK